MPHSSYLRDDIRARSFDREHGFLLGSLEDVWAGHATHASVAARSAQRASVCLMGTLHFYIVLVLIVFLYILKNTVTLHLPSNLRE